jgi:hypothetical protein
MVGIELSDFIERRPNRTQILTEQRSRRVGEASLDATRPHALLKAVQACRRDESWFRMSFQR